MARVTQRLPEAHLLNENLDEASRPNGQAERMRKKFINEADTIRGLDWSNLGIIPSSLSYLDVPGSRLLLRSLFLCSFSF